MPHFSLLSKEYINIDKNSAKFMYVPNATCGLLWCNDTFDVWYSIFYSYNRACAQLFTSDIQQFISESIQTKE